MSLTGIARIILDPRPDAMMPPFDSPPIEATVTIQKPVAAVFGFYRDFRNLPHFLGDVMAVDVIDATTTRWTIQGPLGIQAHWSIKVTELRANELICYETITVSELRTRWEVHFSPGPTSGTTQVREVMHAPLGAVGRAALALIGKHPAQEVTANLHRLKEILETGHVTDTSYAVSGKFGGK